MDIGKTTYFLTVKLLSVIPTSGKCGTKKAINGITQKRTIRMFEIIYP